MPLEMGSSTYFTAHAGDNEMTVAFEVVNNSEEDIGPHRNFVGAFSDGEQIGSQYFARDGAHAYETYNNHATIVPNTPLTPGQRVDFMVTLDADAPGATIAHETWAIVIDPGATPL